VPKTDAFAERWVRTVRTECLDWMLIWNRRHLQKVMAEYVAHYNPDRPDADSERAPASTAEIRRIERVDVLGGLVHEYHRAA
jgi:putative transposase